MEFPRQEYWNDLPFPSPGDLPDLGIESTSPTLTGTEPPRKSLSSLNWEKIAEMREEIFSPNNENQKINRNKLNTERKENSIAFTQKEKKNRTHC